MKEESKKLLLEHIRQVSQDYEVSLAKVGETFSESVIKVLSKFYQDRVFNVSVNLDTGDIISQVKYVVVDNLPDGEYDDFNEITLDDSKKYGDYKVGDLCLVDFDLLNEKNLPKQQIAQILQIFKQRLNEINNVKVYQEWAPRIGQIINAEVEKSERGGYYIVNLENNNFGFLSKKEAIPGEDLKPGSKYQFLIKDVKEHSKGWPILLSRADVEFVNKLLMMEIPEIASGEIKVEVIKRIPGFKTKIAVSNTTNSTFDPAAVVVGAKGSRIKNLSSLINNEKVEVIKYSENFKEFLLNVCGASNLVGYQIVEPKKIEAVEQPAEINADSQSDTNDDISKKTDNKPHVTLVVNDDVLPVIIGKKGFNIKLIAMMLNCSIDINTIEQAMKLNLNYEKVTYTPQQAFATQAKPLTSSNKTFKQPSHSAKNNKLSVSNEDLLEEFQNLSEDEIKALYNIEMFNKDSSSSSSDESSMNSMNEYEDLDLSDAFADEIANATKNQDEKDK